MRDDGGGDGGDGTGDFGGCLLRCTVESKAMTQVKLVC
jgi:hypothetical protein